MCVSQDRFHTARRNGLHTLPVPQNRFHVVLYDRFHGARRYGLYAVLYDRFHVILRNVSYFAEW